MISSFSDLIDFVSKIDKISLKLNVTLDIPQFITAHGCPSNFTHHSLRRFILDLYQIKQRIKSIHLWGKRRSPSGRWVSHVGSQFLF